MRSRWRRIATAIGLALGGAFLTSGPGTSCSSFAGESMFTSTDFCFIFDCQNGILGGTIDPCSEGEGAALFVDCPTTEP